MFAHVRAATPGMTVDEINCHPFQSGPFLWMHNGHVTEFQKIKRRLIGALDEDHFAALIGTTDSEHIFALFLTELKKTGGENSPDSLITAITNTISLLNSWSKEACIQEPNYYNFALTDGETIITTRYVSDPSLEAASLYYSTGENFIFQDPASTIATRPNDNTLLIASEPLTRKEKNWTKVPNNHMIIDSRANGFEVRPILPVD